MMLSSGRGHYFTRCSHCNHLWGYASDSPYCNTKCQSDAAQKVEQTIRRRIEYERLQEL